MLRYPLPGRLRRWSGAMRGSLMIVDGRYTFWLIQPTLAHSDWKRKRFGSAPTVFMRRLLTRSNSIEPFQEEDLRSTTPSDMSIDEAQALLGRLSMSPTIPHYRITGSQLMPHSLKSPFRKK